MESPSEMVHLEASVFGQPEALPNSRNGVASVCVPSHILIDALQPYLQARAPI